MSATTLTTTLSTQINTEHQACMQAAGKALDHAMRCGDLLSEAKSTCKHGEWQGWLDDNFDGSDRSAQAYMRLAGKREQIEQNRRGSADLSIDGALKLLAGPKSDAVHVSQNTGNPEWYTPPDVLDAARTVLGDIELDPASSKIAQKTVKANRHYTAENDGLSKKWKGATWLNPPYASGLVSQFTEKLSEHYAAGDIPTAILLVNNATDTKWFQSAVELCSAVCFIAGRLKFLDESGTPARTPLQGQAVLYYGDNASGFIETFSDFGFCVPARGAA
jgi:phage N-6-adenine-methyltransferase